MALLFWGLRLIAAFAVVIFVMFSWRASLTIAVCLFADFFGMVVAGMPGGGTWSHARFMLGIGLCLGASVSWGRERGNYYDLPALALAVVSALSLSWIGDLDGLHSMLQTWPASLASIVALPIGCMCVTAAADVSRRELKRFWQR